MLPSHATENHAVGTKEAKGRTYPPGRKTLSSCNVPLVPPSIKMQSYLESKRNPYKHKIHRHYAGTEDGLGADKKYIDN